MTAAPPDQVSAHVLAEGLWYEKLARAAAPLPFGERPWIRWGVAHHGSARFLPVQVRWGDDGDLLIGLLTRETSAQVGCFGYSTVCTGPEWNGAEAPGIERLAPVLADTLGLDSVHGLLPPPGLSGVPVAVGPGFRPGPATHLLAVPGDRERAWTRAHGRARTSVRRAGALGLRARTADGTDSAVLRRLYTATMRRNDRIPPSDLDLDFLVDRDRPDVITHVAAAGTDVQAMCAFAISDRSAFHIVQATSDEGLRTNAGPLAFWSVVADLADRGGFLADLGSATGSGQERFKESWGAERHDTQMYSWEREVR